MFTYRNSPAGKAEGGCPSVFVVDSQATRPVLPPRPNQGRRHGGACQTLLFMLVSLALCGMVIEACFIYYLYHTETATSASFSKFMADQDATAPPKQSSYEILPSKPVAHLTDGQDVVHDKQVMAWSMKADPLLYEMKYNNGSLIIQKQGYYYVYSKVFFMDSGNFHHYIKMHTEKYAGGIITLLQARKYAEKSDKARSNSFLGGVFHLYVNDAIYVNVSSTAKIVKFKPYENIFGAFMI
ncbi:tumor necrosis factor ligand superfamily member 14 isoform X2 [Stegastes partitus]|nr:PREDICTED: tumor necrosis factor ligand superfamily member 14-like isoform X2 [Stegastes partitus]